MSSHNDVIYIRLDVRGAKGQGKKKLYRRLGGVEVADQIAALEWVADYKPFAMSIERRHGDVVMQIVDRSFHVNTTLVSIFSSTFHDVMSINICT